MKKLVLLFVLTVGLSSCSNNQDSLIEEAISEGKVKNKDTLHTKAADECGEIQDDMRAIRNEITLMEIYMTDTRTSYERREIDSETYFRRVWHGRSIIENYSNQLNYLRSIYDSCINL